MREDKQQAVALKACPKCKSPGQIFSEDGMDYWVECTGCGYFVKPDSGDPCTAEEAARAWNRRRRIREAMSQLWRSK